MTLTPQCAQAGASAWIAHEKQSNTCFLPAISISKDLS